MKSTKEHAEDIRKAIGRLVSARTECADIGSPILGLRDALRAPFQGTTSSCFAAAFVERHVKPGEFPNGEALEAINRLISDLESGGHVKVFNERYFSRDLGL